MTITENLIARRNRTLGSHSPLFYNEPLQFVSAKGVWFTDVHGDRYLDGYNNVPHVGHCNERVLRALADQASTLNVHTRYLNDRVIDYAEQLLATFDDHLNRVFFTNSGSEANELALRIARQHTRSKGVIVSDFSYHGNTSSLAELTTALDTQESLADHARAFHVPDMDLETRDEAAVLATALTEFDALITSLVDSGHGVSACLFDSLFSSEGMPRLPEGLISGMIDRIHAAGGLVIADEVQSGFGRTGTHMWGYQRVGMVADLVTLGKPMGNGHPMAAVVTSEALLEEFGSANMFFNTFAGNPVSAAVGEAVLREMADRDLMEQARVIGASASTAFNEFAARYDFIRSAKGVGTFLGLDFGVDGAPAPALAKRVVESMKARKVLISRVGPHDNVLKVRPPLTFSSKELPILLDALQASLDEI